MSVVQEFIGETAKRRKEEMKMTLRFKTLAPQARDRNVDFKSKFPILILSHTNVLTLIHLFIFLPSLWNFCYLCECALRSCNFCLYLNDARAIHLAQVVDLAQARAFAFEKQTLMKGSSPKRLLQPQRSEACSFQGILQLAIFRASCGAKKFRDKLQKKKKS